MGAQTLIKWQQWQHSASLDSKEFTCGYCGLQVGSHVGYYPNNRPDACIYICTTCGLPTFFFGSDQYPGASIGREINGLPDDIASVYKELRNTAKDSSYTAALMLGRKLIMHIAVEAGAKEGDSFKSYVNYLSTNHYLPPNADKLLEYMRKLGNEKNHEIKLGTQDEVEKVIKFVEALLYFVYELSNEFNVANKTDSDE